ncbi:hypothetical protein [Lysobacter silvisoli]|uniref:Biopolymer transporter ExbD n=1 Tax=Lysobacter silvisoli TaxID=2293254 RepID=A0A371K1W9_9GAMM|nr:hypothetical protein [Lysobacter silvisoli]RDZ27874.1 hypothetical protein DX914_01510 [Lysobacter silvisoli]
MRSNAPYRAALLVLLPILALAAGCEPDKNPLTAQADVKLPQQAAATPAAGGVRHLLLRDDGRAHSAQGPVELPLAIRALGPPASTEVILQGCKADIDYRYIAFALRALKEAGYERVTVKGGDGQCG